MAFAKPNINKISTDIRDISIYIRTIKKFGKSTLFRDVILEKFNNDPSHGVLISIGKESGDKFLDNLNRLHVDTYKEFMELKQWLISTKGTEHNIEIIGFDTVDEMIPIFEAEVIRKFNVEEKPPKLCTSIKAAYGGYNRGVEETAALIKDYVYSLTKAGFSLWAIAHTKYKQIKQKGDIDEGYMQLTSNLSANYEAVFGDIFDVTLTGYVDRELDEEDTDIGGKTVTKRYATDSIRKLYFRGTSLIDAGGRFAHGAVPEYIVFDKPNMAKDFIEVIESGMEKSKSKNAIAPTPIEMVEDTTAKATVTTDNDVGDGEEVQVEALKASIQSKFKAADKAVKKEIKDALVSNGFSTLNENVPVALLYELLHKLN